MMYLSKIQIDWQWAKDPYQQHRALWTLFPDMAEQNRDFLFRVEALKSGQEALILMQSLTRPISSEHAQVLACKSFELAIPTGTQLRFRLRANPIKSIKDEKGRLNRKGSIKSCRVPLVREEEQIGWLERKLTDAVRLETVAVVQERPWFFRKQQRAGKIQPVCFEGVLQVIDADQLIDILAKGIGPAKAMGCGLLSLAST